MLRRVASSIPHRPLLRPLFTPTPPSLPASTTSSATASLPMLAAEDDRFGGKLVAMESIAAHDSVASFAESLATSLDAWREEGKRGIWLNIPKERTELMPAAIEAGFDLHHTEPDRIVLNSWLGGGTNMLPGCELPAHQNPPRTPCVSPLMLLLAPTTDTTHTMGIGAVVINEQRQVLAVQEATGPASEIGGANNFWKYPTGCVRSLLLLPLVVVLTWMGGGAGWWKRVRARRRQRCVRCGRRQASTRRWSLSSPCARHTVRPSPTLDTVPFERSFAQASDLRSSSICCHPTSSAG